MRCGKDTEYNGKLVTENMFSFDYEQSTNLEQKIY